LDKEKENESILKSKIIELENKFIKVMEIKKENEKTIRR
jgi:hypothetical protein